MQYILCHFKYLFFQKGKKKRKRKGSSFGFQKLACAAFLVGDQTACLKVSSKFSTDSACTLCASKTDSVTSASFTIKG